MSEHQTAAVRTTLTIDDDIAAKLRRLCERRRRPFKEIVNAVLRRGLTAQQGRAEQRAPFRVQPFRSRFRAGVDPLRLNQLSDELETRPAAERPA